MVRFSAFLSLLLILSSSTAQESVSVKPSEFLIEAKLIDDSVVKLMLADEKLELVTPYGKLFIPVSEIRRVEVGFRIPEDVAKTIDGAILDLGHTQFRKREEACAILLKQRERAYPALLKATKSNDSEVVKRAEELVDQIRITVSESRLDLPEHDVVHTDHSKITGKLTASLLKAKSFTFGDVQLKLADVASLTTQGFGDDKELAGALADPGTLTNYQNQVGKTFVFKVTGGIGGSIWGTEMYTLDSSLAAAAVHMGIVKQGQPGFVKVKILGPSVNFAGSTRNGVTTSPYATYPGAYKILSKGTP